MNRLPRNVLGQVYDRLDDAENFRKTCKDARCFPPKPGPRPWEETSVAKYARALEAFHADVARNAGPSPELRDVMRYGNGYMATIYRVAFGQKMGFEFKFHRGRLTDVAAYTGDIADDDDDDDIHFCKQFNVLCAEGLYYRESSALRRRAVVAAADYNKIVDAARRVVGYYVDGPPPRYYPSALMRNELKEIEQTADVKFAFVISMFAVFMRKMPVRDVAAFVRVRYDEYDAVDDGSTMDVMTIRYTLPYRAPKNRSENSSSSSSYSYDAILGDRERLKVALLGHWERRHAAAAPSPQSARLRRADAALPGELDRALA